MTKKLEDLFGFPPSGIEDVPVVDSVSTVNDSVSDMSNTLSELDKIEQALPAVRGLESSDAEMDELATMAVKEFNNLLDLGMNVDSRYASEIFGVASQMLGHAITAKTAKVNKKLKIIELQLKKAKLDQDSGNRDNSLPTGEGTILDRNELLSRLINRNADDTAKK
jgi:hypothetical protein